MNERCGNLPHWWPRQRTSNSHIGDYRLSMEAADSSPPTEASRVAVRLPTSQQAILIGQPEGNWNAAARCVDRIYEVALQPQLAGVTPNPGSTALLQGIEDLSHQVAALSTKQDRLRGSLRDPRPSSRNPWSSLRPQQDRPQEQLTPASHNSPGHSTSRHSTTTSHNNYIPRWPRSFPRSLQSLSDHLRGGVIWEPPTLVTPTANIISIHRGKGQGELLCDIYIYYFHYVYSSFSLPLLNCGYRIM
jgi:hypothetical protein